VRPEGEDGMVRGDLDGLHPQACRHRAALRTALVAG
jgi:hypothetical protein